MGLTKNQIIAREKRKTVSGPCSRKNIIDLNEIVGEDELFVDGFNSTDDDVTNGTEIVDVVDGNSAVLSDLMDVVEPPSTESILEAWRNSVARQAKIIWLRL